MGALHRAIRLATRPDRGNGGEARAVVEDDFHHFRVSILHRDGCVVEARAQALRSPTVLCPSAGARLEDLRGMRLSTSSAAVMLETDARQQCTHMIDLAGLAVAAAAGDIRRRRYHAEVPDRVNGRTVARLWRDGALVLTWQMDHSRISGPAPFTGRSIGSGFTGWARALPDIEAEAALVLRRAAFISDGRGIDLDAPGRTTGPIGGCWTWQPERAHLAARVVGSTRDFTDWPERLVIADEQWVRFEE